MTQANDVLETLEPTESNFEELLIDEGDDRDDLFDAQPDDEEDGDGKAVKEGLAAGPKPRRSTTQKIRFASTCKRLVGFAC